MNGWASHYDIASALQVKAPAVDLSNDCLDLTEHSLIGFTFWIGHILCGQSFCIICKAHVK